MCRLRKTFPLILAIGFFPPLFCMKRSERVNFKELLDMINRRFDEHKKATKQVKEQQKDIKNKQKS